MSHSHGTPDPAHCPDCALGAFVRNNYFTGKLMVERDFTDEQRFHIDKLRHHHQRLHGWGVVCGMKVKQHPNPACRDRYVIVEPGTAIDCCGHEILLREEVMFPFADDPEVKALVAGRIHHRLQICIRYKECPTEEIPVLFDECGCDETRCAPNRILESYELDVMVDAPPTEEDPSGVHLESKNTILIAQTRHIALHDATQRLYIMQSGALFAVSTANHAIVVTRTFSTKGLALAVSTDGKQVYAAIENVNPGSAPDIHVLDANNLAGAPIATLSIGSAAVSPIILVAAPNQRLFALFMPSGNVAVWDDPSTSGGPTTVITGSPNLRGLVLSTDGKRGFTADAASQGIRSFDTQAVLPVLGANLAVDPASTPSCLAVAHSTAGDTLAVGDETNKKLYLVTVDGSKPVKVTALTHHPVALIASPGGKWIYVLGHDQGAPDKWFIEPVDTDRVQLDLPGKLGTIFPISENSAELALSGSGQTLYSSFDDETGGVAIIDVGEDQCAELLWKGLDGCPSCDTANCVVLATMENYAPGDQLDDQTDPSADPVADADAQIARIDNRRDRRLLLSTHVLTEVVKCMLEHSGGGEGKQGPPGLPGPAGPAGPEGAQGPRGGDGDAAGAPKLDLPRIVAINWPHSGKIKMGSPEFENLARQGLVIAFEKSKPVIAETLDVQSVQVLFEHKATVKESRYQINCYCNVLGVVSGVDVDADCEKGIVRVEKEDISQGSVSGSRFRPVLMPRDGLGWELGNYRVVLEGDFILGFNQVSVPHPSDPAKKIRVNPALDANHLAPGLLGPAGLKMRCPTGNGTEGGRFTSWFSIVQG